MPSDSAPSSAPASLHLRFPDPLVTPSSAPSSSVSHSSPSSLSPSQSLLRSVAARHPPSDRDPSLIDPFLSHHPLVSVPTIANNRPPPIPLLASSEWAHLPPSSNAPHLHDWLCHIPSHSQPHSPFPEHPSSDQLPAPDHLSNPLSELGPNDSASQVVPRPPPLPSSPLDPSMDLSASYLHPTFRSAPLRPILHTHTPPVDPGITLPPSDPSPPPSLQHHPPSCHRLVSTSPCSSPSSSSRSPVKAAGGCTRSILTFGLAFLLALLLFRMGNRTTSPDPLPSPPTDPLEPLQAAALSNSPVQLARVTQKTIPDPPLQIQPPPAPIHAKEDKETPLGSPLPSQSTLGDAPHNRPGESNTTVPDSGESFPLPFFRVAASFFLSVAIGVALLRLASPLITPQQPSPLKRLVQTLDPDLQQCTMTGSEFRACLDAISKQPKLLKELIGTLRHQICSIPGEAVRLQIGLLGWALCEDGRTEEGSLAWKRFWKEGLKPKPSMAELYNVVQHLGRTAPVRSLPARSLPPRPRSRSTRSRLAYDDEANVVLKEEEQQDQLGGTESDQHTLVPLTAATNKCNPNSSNRGHQHNNNKTIKKTGAVAVVKRRRKNSTADLSGGKNHPMTRNRQSPKAKKVDTMVKQEFGTGFSGEGDGVRKVKRNNKENQEGGAGVDGSGAGSGSAKNSPHRYPTRRSARFSVTTSDSTNAVNSVTTTAAVNTGGSNTCKKGVGTGVDV